MTYTYPARTALSCCDAAHLIAKQIPAFSTGAGVPGRRAGLDGQPDETLVPGLAADREGGSSVIDVRVDGSKLRVRLAGWDAFAVCWRFSWQWEVPVSKIVRVYVRPARPALPFKSRTHWGPHLPELRRVRAGLPSLWVDIGAEKHQRLAVSSADAEDLAGQIARAGIPVKIRHGRPGPLTASDVARLAAGEFTRGD